jgi:hypothetical protein
MHCLVESMAFCSCELHRIYREIDAAHMRRCDVLFVRFHASNCLKFHSCFEHALHRDSPVTSEIAVQNINEIPLFTLIFPVLGCIGI